MQKHGFQITLDDLGAFTLYNAPSKQPPKETMNICQTNLTGRFVSPRPSLRPDAELPE